MVFVDWNCKACYYPVVRRDTVNTRTELSGSNVRQWKVWFESVLFCSPLRWLFRGLGQGWRNCDRRREFACIALQPIRCPSLFSYANECFCKFRASREHSPFKGTVEAELITVSMFALINNCLYGPFVICNFCRYFWTAFYAMFKLPYSIN